MKIIYLGQVESQLSDNPVFYGIKILRNGVLKEIFDNQRDKKRTEARSLLCFWGKEELSMTQRELALILNLTPPAVSYMVKRGRMIAAGKGYTI